MGGSSLHGIGDGISVVSLLSLLQDELCSDPTTRLSAGGNWMDEQQ